MQPRVGSGDRRRRAIGLWLLIVAGMIVGMVVLGGLTRLTGSGLSMVDWHPVTGWLPPLSHAEWEATFRAYQAYPEYRKINAGMTLPEFQGIFWLEYVHRLWGRLVGVAFALPLLAFLVRGWIDRSLGWKLVGLFLLGGLQGAVGWYMVASGLVDRPDVSQYRLVLHLGFALAIYASILWVAMGLLTAPGSRIPVVPAGPGRRARALTALIFVTILSGGFVAGTDAGFVYNTFPLMGGRLFPADIFALSPWWRSLFEDVTTVQFVHRVLATTTFLSVLAFRVSLVGRPLPARARAAADLLTAWVFVQVSLGIATLLTVVALPLASLHQLGAVVLLSLALWTTRELSPAPAARGAVPDGSRTAAGGAPA